MLVLSRRPDEKIIFPELNITIQVVEVQGRKVRLGIEAPPEVAVLRAELCQGEGHEPGRTLKNVEGDRGQEQG